MLGAIAGDMIGSVYEAAPIKHEDFPLWDPHCRATDDSVLTVAIADAAMRDADYRAALLRWGHRYPHAAAHPACRAGLALPHHAGRAALLAAALATSAGAPDAHPGRVTRTDPKRDAFPSHREQRTHP